MRQNNTTHLKRFNSLRAELPKAIEYAISSINIYYNPKKTFLVGTRKHRSMYNTERGNATRYCVHTNVYTKPLVIAVNTCIPFFNKEIQI